MNGRLLNDGRPLFEAEPGGSVTQTVLQPSAHLNDHYRAFYVEWGEGVIGGELTVESGRADFGGDWAHEGVVSFQRANSTQRITLCGAFLAIKIKISKPLLGGRVAVYGCAN